MKRRHDCLCSVDQKYNFSANWPIRAELQVDLPGEMKILEHRKVLGENARPAQKLVRCGILFSALDIVLRKSL